MAKGTQLGNNKQVSIYLPDDLLEEVNQMAELFDMSFSQAVRSLIRDGLAEQNKRMGPLKDIWADAVRGGGI